MALTATPSFGLPMLLNMNAAATPAMSNFLIDAAGETAAAVIDPPKTGNLHRAYIRAGTQSVSGNFDFRVETVNSTGDPSGSLLAANTHAQTISFAASSWMTATLTADAPVVAGTPIALCILRNSGGYNIIGATGNVISSQFPYGDHFTSAWAKNSAMPAIVLEYDDGTIYDILGQYGALVGGAFTYGSGSAPDEHGVKFTAPVGMQTDGFWWVGNLTADADMVLYDGSDNVLVTRSMDDALRFSNAVGPYRMFWSSMITLTASATYRLILKPTSASTVVLHYADAASAAAMAALPGGAGFIDTARTDAGAWTDTNTRQPMMGLNINAIDTGGGAGIARLVGGGLVRG